MNLVERIKEYEAHPVIQDATIKSLITGYKFYASLNDKNIRDLIEEHFMKEIKDRRVKLGLSDEDYHFKGSKVAFFYFQMKSSESTAHKRIFENHFQPVLESDEMHYSNKDVYRFRACFEDVFINAIIHGNKGGEKAIYNEKNRYRKTIPVPKNYRANWKKPICVECAISDKFYILRIIDRGKGIKLKNGDAPKGVTYLQDLIKRKKKTGTGMKLMEKVYSGEYDEVIFKKESKSFQVTMIKVKE